MMLGNLGILIFKIKEKNKFKFCESIFSYWRNHFYGHKFICIEEDVCIGNFSWITAYKLNVIDPLLYISKGVSIGRFSHIYIKGKLVIGKSALIAEKVYISDNLHGFEDIKKPIKDQSLRQLNEVSIGDGAWIGENVCIIGASVGKNSVIGANSVVTHDIPDYCVAVGAPARVVKRYDFKANRWIRVD